MSHLSRRRLLQGAGATLATLGLHYSVHRHQTVLAQSTPRKLALIVGINKYPRAPLRGCVNDAILQFNLLVYHFGFNPDDVLILEDEEATRDGILTAFEEHLIKQAKPGDVAFFHYSGHGSLVRDPDAIFSNRRDQGVNGTFVPIDGRLGNPDATDGEQVQDIMGHTLFLLMSAIQTENFTAVLDSCHSGGADRPELRVRAVRGGETIEIAPQELEYQQQWLSRFGWSRQEFVERYQRGIAKGVVLAGADELQLAVDEPLNGFTAGAFTYRLTQYLWQNNTTPVAAIDHVNSIMPTRYRQNPQVEAKPGSGNADKPMLFLEPPNTTADALVKDFTEDGRAVVLLVAVDPGIVKPGMVFRTRTQTAQVVVERRDGLFIIGQVNGNLRKDDLLRLS